MGTSKIEWTEATWNPVTGCTPISEGCEHCYAKRMATRLRGRSGYPEDEPFKVTAHPERLKDPLGWRKPKKIFVCSMGDLFHEDVPVDWIDSVIGVIAKCEQHRFMLLSKRTKRMKIYFLGLRDEPEQAIRFLSDGPGRIKYGLHKYALTLRRGEHLRNVWLGVTAENQRRADERIPVLLEIPAARRFVSIEPMLGPVDLRRAFGTEGPRQTYIEQLDWVICGGETGPGARPLHPDWVRSLRDQCQAAGVPFFFKSWGEFQTNYDEMLRQSIDYKPHSFNGLTFVRCGKKQAGRILDGRTWNEEPEDVETPEEGM